MITDFLFIYILLVTIYYLVPAGLMYYIFFIRKREKWKHMRIQGKFPVKGTVRREICWSLFSLALFALYTTGLVRLINLGYTKMYFDLDEYGIGWLILSPVAALFIHDTFYYFMHRLMHWKVLFRYVHLVHHKSVAPTPFAIYSFQPAETLVQFAIYPLLLFALPYHPYALGVFLLYDLFVNTAGHCGFEFLPPKFTRHWYFRWQNAVTHHDQHHSKVNCNYGLYFNIWDRVFKTLHHEYEARLERKQPDSTN